MALDSTMSGEIPVSQLPAVMSGPNAHLRLLAGIEYATSPDAPSIEGLHKDTRFAVVSLRTMERWASEDKWTEQRRQHVAKWTELVRERLGERLAQMRLEDLSLLEKLRNSALKQVSDDEHLKFKSLDAGMMTISRLTMQLDEIRRTIGGDVLANMGQPVLPAGDTVHPQFSKDDIEGAARELLLRRQFGASPSTVLDSEDGDLDRDTDPTPEEA